MEVAFSKNKTCDAFKVLMENPIDRQAQKIFLKHYNKEILKASVKVYQKMVSSDNALIYNQTSTGHNKIELATGTKKKESLILKVRIQGDYRKFFHFYQTNTSGQENFCMTEEWEGQFDKIRKIHIFEVNKHDYSVV